MCNTRQGCPTEPQSRARPIFYNVPLCEMRIAWDASNQSDWRRLINVGIMGHWCFGFARFHLRSKLADFSKKLEDSRMKKKEVKRRSPMPPPTKVFADRKKKSAKVACRKSKSKPVWFFSDCSDVLLSCETKPPKTVTFRVIFEVFFLCAELCMFAYESF